MYGMKVLLRDDDGVLCSWFDRQRHPTTWALGEWQEAECRCAALVNLGEAVLVLCLPHEHPPCRPLVATHAGCGFHAATSSSALGKFVHDILGGAARVFGDLLVYALVEGGGDIAAHESGFRSQYMRIVETFETLWDLEQAYNKIKEAQNEWRAF